MNFHVFVVILRMHNFLVSLTLPLNSVWTFDYFLEYLIVFLHLSSEYFNIEVIQPFTND